MRLNRFLASAGQGSRRSCEELILAGQVSVNGVVCTELATQVESSDVVKVGNRVLHSAPTRTLLIHKPRGFVSTASDEKGRRTVFDLLPPNSPRLFHVGRLDMESEGLLILTNDGDLSLKLTHPRYRMEKEYEVVLDRPFDFELSARLLHGVNTPEGWAKAEAVHRLGANKVKMVLTQGLKRQIRLMFYELGYEVERLVRTRIGTLKIDNLPPAAWRVLTRKEIEALLASGGEKPPRQSVRSTATSDQSDRSEKPLGRTPRKISTRPAAPSSGAARNAGPRTRQQPPRRSSRSEDDPGRSRREGSPRRASR